MTIAIYDWESLLRLNKILPEQMGKKLPNSVGSSLCFPGFPT